MNAVRRALAIVLVLASSVGAAQAGSQDPQPGTAAWYRRSVQNHLDAQGRWIDQMSNPDYLAKAALGVGGCVETQTDLCMYVDPYRRKWAPARGSVQAVTWKNRYQVPISGHLWLPKLPFTDPVTSEVSDGPFPAVIHVNGSGSAEQSYWAMAQGLAESGYAVLTFDPQCAGSSGCQPPSQYCDPNGAWRAPQEMGLREQGACAGIGPSIDPTTHPLAYIADNASFGIYGAGCILNGCNEDTLAADYIAGSPTYAFGALDAASWLLSNSNPKRNMIDETRVGITGHSYGAYGALLAGNGDPAERFSAAVIWEGYGRIPTAVPPRVPTMFHMADSEEAGGPYRSPPDPNSRIPHANALAFVGADIATMKVVPRGSTHQEWNYTPFYTGAEAGQFVASRDGERVGLYYTLAWFDRYLKGANTSLVRGDESHQAAAARTRLMAEVFDTSSDRSSIGQGAWDPLTLRNVPYTIGGESVADHLSFYFRSFYNFDGFSCDDIRLGCN